MEYATNKKIVCVGGRLRGKLLCWIGPVNNSNNNYYNVGGKWYYCESRGDHERENQGVMIISAM